MTKDFGVRYSFDAGELSKKMRGRIDLPQHKKGCERIENFIVYPQGSVSFRDGFVFSSYTRENRIALVHKYHYKNNYYILEYTDLALRIHDKDGVITDRDENLNVISRSGNIVHFRIISAPDFNVGDYVQFSGLNILTELNDVILKVDNIVGGQHECVIDRTFTVPSKTESLNGQVSSILETVTPYEEKDLFELQFAQTATELYVTNNLYNPAEIVYLPQSNTLALVDFNPTGLSFSTNNYPSAVTFFENRLFLAGSITNPQRIWGSKAGDINDFTTGSNLADGVEYTLSSTEASVIRTLSSTSKLLVIGTSGGTFGATTATENTSFEVRPIDGFPVELISPIQKNNTVISVQAGARKLRSLDYSFQADGYTSTDLNVSSEDITEGNIKQISYLEGSPEVIWCVKRNGELIGLTYKPEVKVYAWHRQDLSGDDKILSADSLTRDLNYEQLHVVVEREIDGRTVRTIERMADSLDYPIPEDFYTGKTNQLSDTDLFKHMLLEQQKSYIHVDGALTYDGSTFSAGATDAITLSALTGEITVSSVPASIFADAEVGQQIWEKTMTGAERGRAVITEVVSNSLVNCTVLVNFTNLTIDAGNYYLTTNKVTGINHLEGREVRVITDGAVHPVRTVVDGSIDLEYQASVIHVGTGYTGIVKTTDMNTLQYFGQTKPKNAYKFGIKLLDTIGASIGTNIYRAEQLLFRSTNSLLNNPPELFTGEKVITYGDNWAGSKNIIILQEESLPCTILMIVTYLTTGER